MDMRGLLRSSTNSPPAPPAAAVGRALFLLPVESAERHEGEDGLFLPQDADAEPPAPAGGARGGSGRTRLAAVVGVVLARRAVMLPGLFFLGDLTTDRAGGVLGEDGRGEAEAGESFFHFFLLLLMLGSSTTTSISTSVSLQARALRNSAEKRGPDDNDGEE